MQVLKAVSAAFVLVLAGCATPRDSHELLAATLWMQTSAEYRADSEAAYRWARITLDRALAEPGWTAALEQTSVAPGSPPAVIMDLDETVLDNSRFEGELIKRRTVYSPALWSEWVAKAEAEAVPGAVEFIRYAESKGVTVFFVTNRNQAEEAGTRANLAKLGISASTNPDRVLVSGENGWTSDKTARRAEVAKTHRILLLVGDDLGDFVSGNRAPPAERRALAERYKDRWGERWVLLANPLYGSWDQVLYDREMTEEQQLKRKLEQVRGF